MYLVKAFVNSSIKNLDSTGRATAARRAERTRED